jgi:hypothetical protein
MFTGLVYTVDPTDGSYAQSFDCETITPHIEVPVRGGMTQLLAMPRSGRRLIFGSFQAGQVGMLDITNPREFKQVSIVSFGLMRRAAMRSTRWLQPSAVDPGDVAVGRNRFADKTARLTTFDTCWARRPGHRAGRR